MMRNENGSVLIEAMVAAAIISLMLVVLYQSLADSVAHEKSLRQKRTALLIAQSELDAVGTVLPLAPGVTSGVEGNYVWRAQIEPSNIFRESGSVGGLWNVSISVRENGGSTNLVMLTSLAVGPSP